MNNFREREKGFEAQFARDQELAFRITARRNKLLGLWAAERLGLRDAEAEAYARTVVEADFEAPGDDDIIAKVRSDLAARGIALGDSELAAQLAYAATEARRQLTQA